MCQETNSVVVLSSTWRLNKTLIEIQNILINSGATFEIIGKTKFTGYERGTEISLWLKENINTEEHGCFSFDFYRYVIIDDDSDMLLDQATNFFQTDKYSGLTSTTCSKIKQFLIHQTF